MGRVWKPVKMIEERDGKRRPGAIVWMFLGLAVIGVWAGGTQLLRENRQQQAAAAWLTKTITATASETPEPSRTPQPSTTPEPSETPIPPTETPYVYDDPATWELVQVTDIAGNTSLDLQDWQKEQVLHAFAEYYNLAWRKMDGAPAMDDVMAFLTEYEYAMYEEDYYAEAVRRGQYLTYPLLKDLFITISYSELEGNEKGGFRVLILVTDPVNFISNARDFNTGEVLKVTDRGPRTFEYRLVYSGNGWLVYRAIIHDIAGINY